MTTNSPAIAAPAVAKFLEELTGSTRDATLGAQQVRLLLALFTYGQLSQQSLGSYTGVQGSANSRNIAKMGRGETLSTKPGLGLVESFEDLTDRREKMVRLTPEGLATIKTALERSFR